MKRPSLAVALSLLAACETTAPANRPPPDSGALSPVDAPAITDAPGEKDVPYVPSARVTERPYMHRVPSSYDPSRPIPLVVLLHGYGASGMVQAGYLNLLAATAAEGFALAYPDGTVDSGGRRFWNATDSCCDFERRGIDDVGYIDAVIDDMRARYNIDPRRVFLIGHSNGGFMAHRYACERARRVAGFVSLAGAAWSDPSRCAPSRAVAALQVHGTADDVIRFNGGSTPVGAGGPHPSARASVEQWVAHNRCAGLIATQERMDLEPTLPGEETRVDRASGCSAGGAELWTIQGGRHIPSFGPEWARALGRWMAAHPSP